MRKECRELPPLLEHLKDPVQYADVVQDQVVDELDLKIVNALQVNPRASWSQLGAVLDADPVTIARRWQRLSDLRVAWITAYPAPLAAQRAAAMVEIDCAGSTLAFAQEIVDDPECATIDITSGGRDLLLTVTASSTRVLTDYLLNRLGEIPTTRSVRTHVITEILSEASNWRLRELTDGQIDRLGDKLRPALTTRSNARLSVVERAVVAALIQDGRMSATDIAEQASVPVRRAREIVSRLLSTGQVRLRTEMARTLSGWPVNAWYFLRVPAAMLAKVGPRLSRLGEIRTVLVTAGPHNLMMAVWMRELIDVAKLEAAIEEQLTGVQITDRSIVLRTTKLVGNVLDADGRRIRHAEGLWPS